MATPQPVFSSPIALATELDIFDNPDPLIARFNGIEQIRLDILENRSLRNKMHHFPGMLKERAHLMAKLRNEPNIIAYHQSLRRELRTACTDAYPDQADKLIAALKDDALELLLSLLQGLVRPDKSAIAGNAYLIGLVHEVSMDYAAAFRAYQRATQMTPGNLKYANKFCLIAMRLGLAYIPANNLARALDHYEETFGEDCPEYTALLYNIAPAYVAVGDADRACGTYCMLMDREETLSIAAPVHRIAMARMAELHVQIGKVSEAEVWFSYAANLYDRPGKEDKARIARLALRQAEINPTNHLGDAETAILFAIKSAAGNQPLLAAAQSALAVIRIHEGRTSEGFTAFKKAWSVPAIQAAPPHNEARRDPSVLALDAEGLAHLYYTSGFSAGTDPEGPNDQLKAMAHRRFLRIQKKAKARGKKS